MLVSGVNQRRDRANWVGLDPHGPRRPTPTLPIKDMMSTLTETEAAANLREARETWASLVSKRSDHEKQLAELGRERVTPLTGDGFPDDVRH